MEVKRLKQCWCGTLVGKMIYANGETLVLCEMCGTARTLLFQKAGYEDGSYHTTHQEAIGKKSYTSQDRIRNDLLVAAQRILQIGVENLQGKVLDVGCGNGSFIAHGIIEGLDVWGMDLVDIVAGPAMRSRVQIGKPYPLNNDVVTMFDVLEHMENPLQELIEIRQTINPGGSIVVEGPRMGYGFFEITESNKHHILPMEHPWYFTRGSYIQILEEAGFGSIEYIFPIPGRIQIRAKLQ